MWNGLTVFLRNPAEARLYFKAPFGAAIIQRWCLQISACTLVHGFNNEPILSTYNAYARMYIAVDPLPCSKVSRAAFIGMSWQEYAAIFQGW